MWRAEEMGVDKLVGIVDIHGVGYRPVLEGTKMMEGVVAYLMSVGNNLLVELRILADVVADHEERGLDVELAQGFENEGSALRNGTVVEGDVDGMLVGVHSPQRVGINPSEPFGWLFYYQCLYGLLLFVSIKERKNQ